MDEVDGEDVREEEQKRFGGEELLRYDGDFDEELRAHAPEQAVELGLRVLRVAVGVCFEDAQAGVRVWVQAALVGGEGVACPDGEEVVAEGAEDCEGRKGYEGVQEEEGSRLDRLAVFVGYVQVGEQQAAPEVGAPR